MIRIVLAGSYSLTAAQIATYADVKAHNGVQLGDKHFGVAKLEDTAPTMEFEFSK
jgi:hypothetical protein